MSVRARQTLRRSHQGALSVHPNPTAVFARLRWPDPEHVSGSPVCMSTPYDQLPLLPDGAMHSVRQQ